MQHILVIYSDEKDEAKAFFEGLGLTFVEEKHGQGPSHWSCQQGDHVLELYPGNSTRLRFMENKDG